MAKISKFYDIVNQLQKPNKKTQMFFCQVRRVISVVPTVVRALMTRRSMANKQQVLSLGFDVV